MEVPHFLPQVFRFFYTFCLKYNKLCLKKHSQKNGYKRHWQLDDNIKNFKRWDTKERKIVNLNLNIVIKKHVEKMMKRKYWKGVAKKFDKKL